MQHAITVQYLLSVNCDASWNPITNLKTINKTIPCSKYKL